MKSIARFFHWEKEFRQPFLRLAFPMVVQNLLSSSLHLVDHLMVGGLGETELAAVAQANRVVSVLIMLLAGLSGGTALFIAQFWGVEKMQEIRRVQSYNLIFSLGVAIVFFLFFLFCPTLVMRCFIGDADVAAQAAEYLRLVGFAFPIYAVSRTFGMAEKTIQRVRVPMVAGVMALAINTTLNMALIYGRFGVPAMGVKGAAYATVISAGVECLILVRYAYAARLPVALRAKDLTAGFRAGVKQYIRTVGPVMAHEGLWAMGTAAFGVAYGLMGTQAVAAFSLYQTLEQISLLLCDGLVHASSVLIGMAVGRGQNAKAVLYGKRSMAVAYLTALWMTGALVALLPPVLDLYRISEEVKLAATNMVLASLAVAPLFSLTWMNLIGVLRAGGDSLFPMAVDLGTMWCIAVPLAFLGGAVLHWAPYQVFFLYNVEQIGKILLGWRRFCSGKWIVRLVEDNASSARGGALRAE